MPESTNTAEGRTESKTGKAPDPTPGNVSDVVDILANAQNPATDDDNQDDNQDDKDNGDARASEKTEVPKSLDDLAQGLGVDVADLYNLEIPLGGDQDPITLGELKDLGKAGSQINLDRIEFDEQRTEFEAEQRKAAQDFADLVASLPKHAVTDELVSKIHKQRAEIQEREERLTAKVIPSWSDPVVKERERSTMSEYLGEFGFPSGFLDNLVDHRTTALIRDAALRKKRLTDALDQVKQVRNTGHGKTSKSDAPRKTSKSSAPKTRSQDTKVDQVATLISSALKG